MGLVHMGWMGHILDDCVFWGDVVGWECNSCENSYNEKLSEIENFLSSLKKIVWNFY